MYAGWEGPLIVQSWVNKRKGPSWVNKRKGQSPLKQSRVNMIIYFTRFLHHTGPILHLRGNLNQCICTMSYIPTFMLIFTHFKIFNLDEQFDEAHQVFFRNLSKDSFTHKTLYSVFWNPVSRSQRRRFEQTLQIEKHLYNQTLHCT